MSEETPDRLKSFRAQYAPQKTSGVKLAIAQLVLITAGFAGVFAFLTLHGGAKSAPAAAAPGGGLTADNEREFAAYLAERQQPMDAVAAYQSYLDKTALSPDERAKVCYTMGKLTADAEQYDAALKYLYQAEFLAPESELKEDIDKKVVLCLDKLGRRADLRSELRKRTSLKRSAADIEPGETVLAEFAGEVITDRDLTSEIEKLPAYMRDSIAGPEKRAEFLKNLVAQRLLLDKAQRLELDKNPEVQEELGKQLDAMIVQKLIRDEVKPRISVTDEDVERFYKATPERFTIPETAQVRVGDADSAEAAQTLDLASKAPVKAAKDAGIPGMPASGEALQAVFAAEPGARLGPYQAESKWFVIEVISKTPAERKPFEQVKDQARRVYEMQKEQEELSALLERILQERDVKLYLDRLKEQEAAS